MIKLPLWDFFEKIWKAEYQYLDFGKEEYWMFVFLALVCLFLVGLFLWMIYTAIYDFIDRKKSTIAKYSGEIIDKIYKGSSTSRGYGTAVIPNTSGGVGVGMISTTSHSPEEFLIFVKTNRMVYKVRSDMQEFYTRNIGDKVIIQMNVGGLSNEYYNVKII